MSSAQIALARYIKDKMVQLRLSDSIVKHADYEANNQSYSGTHVHEPSAEVGKHTIFISPTVYSRSDGPMFTLQHEMVHAVSVAAYYQDEEFAKELDELFFYAKGY